MSFDLQSGGRLVATGTIVPGSAKAFAAEVDKRGDYVKTVVLHSPGGSLEDALSMGRLIRERKFATEVQNGHYCASACPLVFAGGVERRAGAKAGVGVHRAIVVSGGRDGAADGQLVSARAQRYLRDMGVDPAVWIYAMETPNERTLSLQRRGVAEPEARDAGRRKEDRRGQGEVVANYPPPMRCSLTAA